MDKYLTREKLLNLRHHPHVKWGSLIIFILLLADLLILNYKILFTNSKIPFLPFIANDNRVSTPASQTTTVTKAQDGCGENCMMQINKAVTSALSNQNTNSPAQNPAQSSAPAVKEYFIPLGSGVIASTSWTTISGLQATIDGSAYGTIKTATFEISINVPTGNENANFQLYNSSANHPVWNSGVAFTGGGTPQLLISQPITLDPGSNIYIVQGQTQLTFPAYVTQARVHIITN
jgi:hypothetical protein